MTHYVFNIRYIPHSLKWARYVYYTNEFIVVITAYLLHILGISRVKDNDKICFGLWLFLFQYILCLDTDGISSKSCYTDLDES